MSEKVTACPGNWCDFLLGFHPRNVDQRGSCAQEIPFWFLELVRCRYGGIVAPQRDVVSSCWAEMMGMTRSASSLFGSEGIASPQVSTPPMSLPKVSRKRSSKLCYPWRVCPWFCLTRWRSQQWPSSLATFVDLKTVDICRPTLLKHRWGSPGHRWVHRPGLLTNPDAEMGQSQGSPKEIFQGLSIIYIYVCIYIHYYIIYYICIFETI